MGEPQSRNEAILQATIDGTQYTDPPQSRIEDLLLQLKAVIEGGGTTVIANPTGEATAELSKLQVGSAIYSVLTNSVNTLANYYLKTETYTQAEVNALIGAITTLNVRVVEALPTTDISRTTIYLVPKATAGTDNVYDEYLNLDGTSAGWELIGDTEIDLSDYVTDTDLSTALADYVTATGLATTLANYATTSAAYVTDDTAETALADGDYVPFYDTSATAKRKTLWSNIKAVLKTFFDTLYATLSDISAIWSSNARTGVHQWLDYDLAKLKALNTSGTWANNVYTLNNTTFTVNNDLSIDVDTLEGGSSNQAVFVLNSAVSTDIAMKLSGCPSGGGDTTYFLYAKDTSNVYYYDYESGVNVPADKTVSVSIIVRASQTVTDKSFKPLYKDVNDLSNEVTPYAMTNGELTEKVAGNELTISTGNANITLGDETYCRAFLGKAVVIGSLQFTTSAEIAQYNSIASISLGQVPVNKGKFMFAAYSTTQDLYRVTVEAGNTNILGVWVNTAIPSGKTCKFTFVLFT